MQKPNLPDYFMDAIGFARDLITYLGEDPTDIKDNWCWKHLYQRYPHLRPKVEKYLETCNTGNVAMAILNMTRHCGSSREWGEKQLETCKYGTVSMAIFDMVEHCGSSREWGEKLLETCQYGNVVAAIYWMVKYCGSNKEWANKVLISKGLNPKY